MLVKSRMISPLTLAAKEWVEGFDNPQLGPTIIMDSPSQLPMEVLGSLIAVLLVCCGF